MNPNIPVNKVTRFIDFFLKFIDKLAVKNYFIKLFFFSNNTYIMSKLYYYFFIYIYNKIIVLSIFYL